MISYFSQLIGQTPEQSLISVVPYRVKLLESMLIGCMSSNLDWEGILRTLIGNLVALCLFPRDVTQKDQPKTFISSCTSLDIVNNFIGYGICRGYDKTTEELLIVTPLSTIQLNQVNIIISAGEVGLPLPLGGGGKKNSQQSSSSLYVSGQQQGLNAGGKKYFVPGKKSTHNVLKNSLLQ